MLVLVHHAAVLEPPAEPSDRQVSRGPATRTCPVCNAPRDPPKRLTSASRASTPVRGPHG